jgi:hypothetical protein
MTAGSGTLAARVFRAPVLPSRRTIAAALKHELLERIDDEIAAADRKSTRLNSSHNSESRMPSSA